MEGTRSKKESSPDAPLGALSAIRDPTYLKHIYFYIGNVPWC